MYFLFGSFDAFAEFDQNKSSKGFAQFKLCECVFWVLGFYGGVIDRPNSDGGFQRDYRMGLGIGL